ncbi:MAG: alkaline phosphatase family protein [Sulfolobaceae archaeon]|jgi:hypothetical protein
MEFIYPNYQEKSIYNLACGIADFLGVKRECKGKKIELSGRRLVLVLLDGLGYNMLKNAGFPVEEYITTVFPSTTSTVITTLFTALLPAEHGVLGYNTYSKRLGGIVNTLKYTYPLVDSRDSISENVKLLTAFPNIRSYLAESNIKTAEVIPKGIENTEFTNATHGKTSITKTYTNFLDGFYELSQVLSEGQYNFVYFYVPDIDTLAHKHGPTNEVTKEAIVEIYKRVLAVAEKFKDYVFVVTADHGHVQVSDHVLLNNDQSLISLLDILPYGDSRALFLHSRYDLKTYLYDKYPNLVVFTKQDFDILLGGNTQADFIAVPNDFKAYIYVYKEKADEYAKLKGHHGGLSEDEMKVPLVILNG